MPDPKRASKDAKDWTAKDWMDEAVKITGRKDRDSDDVVCAAMMLAALVHGTGSRRRLARAIGVAPGRVDHLYDNLRRNGIFTRRKTHARWFAPDGALEFILDVCCGTGIMERVKAAATT